MSAHSLQQTHMIWYPWVSNGTTKGWKARLVMHSLYSSVFNISFSKASTVVCLLPFPDFQDFSTPNSLTILDAGRYKAFHPNTPLPLCLARNNLISYNAVLTVYVALKPNVMDCNEVSASLSVFK